MTDSHSFRPTIYHTSLIHSLSLTQIQYFLKSLIYVSSHGIIEWIEKDVSDEMVEEVVGRHGIDLRSADGEVDFVQVGKGGFICPGLVDTHTHAPQYPNLGLGQEYQLLDWLKHCTFPREAMFANERYARAVYQEVVKRTLNAGTTTSSYFASLHEGSTKILADVVSELGQRALVGKCNMVANCPDTYCDPSPAQSLSDTLSLISYIRSMPSSLATQGIYPTPLVQPVLTPRFALSCTKQHLDDLGQIAKNDPTLNIQTHLSENRGEIKATKEAYPGSQNYTDVYDQAGLLRKGTILAHCVWLDQEEMRIIKERGAGISHCPTSNLNLASGMARVGKMLDEGIEVGLGSDCSGGFAIGILPQIRNASMVAKMISVESAAPGSASSSTADQLTNNSYTDKPLTIPTLFYLATLGGAKICNLESQIGSFEVGKEFDAIRVQAGTSPNFFYRIGEDQNDGSKSGGDGWWNEDELKRVFERFLFVGDDRDIADVWVRGRRVGGSRRI